MSRLAGIIEEYQGGEFRFYNGYIEVFNSEDDLVYADPDGEELIIEHLDSLPLVTYPNTPHEVTEFGRGADILNRQYGGDLSLALKNIIEEKV